MSKSRLEAYTDAVIAIVITLMVLEIHVPEGATTFAGLLPIAHNFLVYILSFLLLSMYWNNHHHLLQSVSHVGGKVLWSNNFFIFTLTMIPFSTNWLSEHLLLRDPNLLYGFVILLADFAYYILVHQLMKYNGGKSSKLYAIYGQNHKIKLTILCNVIALIAGLFLPWLTLVINLVTVIGLWLIPERGAEKVNNVK